MSALDGGKLAANLKHVADADGATNVKEWKPTAGDLAEDTRMKEQEEGAPKG